MMDAQFHSAIREADDRAAAGEAVDADAPRLKYAEWLDDQGDPRGEYISVSVELANAEQCQCNPPCSSRMDWECPAYQKTGSLRRRQSALLGEHAAEWFARVPGVSYCTNCGGDVKNWAGAPVRGSCHACKGSGHSFKINGDRIETTEGDTYVLRKGFIDEVQITAARFAGGACVWCNGIGNFGFLTVGSESRLELCQVCHGTRRIPGLAGRIGLACPVARSAKIVDRNPFCQHVTGFNYPHWSKAENPMEQDFQEYPCLLPTTLFDLLTGHQIEVEDGKEFPTAALADAALEAACKKFMRMEAVALERKEVMV